MPELAYSTVRQMFNPFESDIVRHDGPYEIKQKVGPPRRSMMFTLANGRLTSMSYARWLMTQHLGRRLEPWEHVDHVNDNCSDDRIENYQLLTLAENNRKANLGRPSPLKGVEKGFTHGSMYGWMKKKCQCEACASAKRAWNDARNLARRSPTARGAYAPRDEIRHGTRAGYEKERARGLDPCEACRAANTDRARPTRGTPEPTTSYLATAAMSLGRPLVAGETVVPIDGDRLNAAPSNLLVFRTRGDVTRYRKTGVRVDMGDGTWTSPAPVRPLTRSGNRSRRSATCECGNPMSDRAAVCAACSMVARRTRIPDTEELHALVWSMPTTAVAERYGVSDVAVAKWCKTYKIDKPPRGYWAKQAATSRSPRRG